MHNPSLRDPKKTDSLTLRHPKDILERLEELAADETPIIIGQDYVRNDGITIIYDGFHRLVATLIYYEKTRKFKKKKAYYGTK